MCQISFQLHLPTKFYGKGALSVPLALERPKKPSTNRVKNILSKCYCWIEYLEEMNIKINYLPGFKNIVDDY